MGMKPENQMAWEILKAHAQGPRSGVHVALVHSSRLASVLAGSLSSGYLHILFYFVICSMEVLQGNNALTLVCCFQTNDA